MTPPLVVGYLHTHSAEDLMSDHGAGAVVTAEHAAFIGLLRARQAEMQGLIDRIVAWLDGDPPAPARRKRATKPQQAALFQTEAP